MWDVDEFLTYTIFWEKRLKNTQKYQQKKISSGDTIMVDSRGRPDMYWHVSSLINKYINVYNRMYTVYHWLLDD